MQKYLLLVLIFALSIDCTSCVPYVRVFEQKSHLSKKTPVEDCECVGNDCGCCQHIKVDLIHLDDTVCINVTYLDKIYGLQVTMSVDGHIFINASVSARDPPPLCVAIPGLKDLASVCLQFYNLDVSSTSFSGCLRLVAKLAFATVDNIDIGCFKIPPSARHQLDSQHLRRSLLMDNTTGVKTWDDWSALRKYFYSNRKQLKQV